MYLCDTKSALLVLDQERRIFVRGRFALEKEGGVAYLEWRGRKFVLRIYVLILRLKLESVIFSKLTRLANIP